MTNSLKLEIEARGALLALIVEGEEWKKIHPSVFGKKPRFSTCQNYEELEVAFKELEYKRALNYCLWRLSAQSYCSFQLDKLLKERLVSKTNREKVLTKIIDDRFIDDEAWMDSYFRVHLKRLSPRAIGQKLAVKGIPQELIAEYQEKWRDEESEVNAIKKLLKGSYRNKEKPKVIAALLRRGFSYELIKAAMNSEARN